MVAVLSQSLTTNSRKENVSMLFVHYNHEGIIETSEKMQLRRPHQGYNHITLVLCM